MVQCEAINGPQQPFVFAHDFFQETACPGPVRRIGAGGDEVKFLSVLRHPSGVAAELGRVLLGSEVPSATPGLVAHTPILHIEGIFETCGSALVGQSGASCGRVAVFHPAVELFRRKASDVGREIRLGANQAAKMRKFAGAEAIGVVPMGSGCIRGFSSVPEIGAAGALVRRPDPIAPIVAVGEAATRDRKSTRLNSSHANISYAVSC